MNNEVTFGSRENRMQTIYEVGLMYVQDADGFITEQPLSE